MTYNSAKILLSVSLLFQPFLLYAENDLAENPSSFRANASKPSNNPIMSLSGDRLNAIPAVPPPKSDSPSGNSRDVVSYNSQTKQTTVTPNTTLRIDDDISKVNAPYIGLLPSEIPLSTESVIGSDGRVQVSNTTNYPWRTIVHLLFKFPNSSSIFSCSGSIVDNFHILTAGHCMHDASRGGYASWIEVYPGQNGSSTPYYKSNATYLRTYAGWTTNQDPNYDFALITLDRNIGSYTGWMGRQTAASTSSIYTGTLNVSGYPSDKPSGTQWFDSDNGNAATTYRHSYFMDTFAGQSGAPVWRYDGTTRNILTVHTNGGSTANSGTRLNTSKFNDINTWRAADTAPTDKADLIDDGLTYAGFSPTTVTVGDSISAYSDVRNIGTASSGSFTVSYYASTNTIITTSDYFLGQVQVSSISPFSWDDADWGGTVPNNIPAGSYYVGWIIDSGNASIEFDENNNVAHLSSPKLTVTEALPPAAATLISPSGSITDTTPTYTWNAVSDSTWYLLWVNDSTGNTINRWYSTVDAGCSSGTGTCSVTPSTVLAEGDGIWWIQTWNSTGFGPWSTGSTFNVSAGVPGAATLISPSGIIFDSTPSYTWNAVPGSTWYYLWINDSTGNKVKSWYLATTAGCASGTGTCSVTPTTVLANGGGTWWVQTWNSFGYGAWSSGQSFTVQ